MKQAQTNIKDHRFQKQFVSQSMSSRRPRCYQSVAPFLCRSSDQCLLERMARAGREFLSFVASNAYLLRYVSGNKLCLAEKIPLPGSDIPVLTIL